MLGTVLGAWRFGSEQACPRGIRPPLHVQIIGHSNCRLWNFSGVTPLSEALNCSPRDPIPALRELEETDQCTEEAEVEFDSDKGSGWSLEAPDTEMRATITADRKGHVTRPCRSQNPIPLAQRMGCDPVQVSQSPSLGFYSPCEKGALPLGPQQGPHRLELMVARSYLRPCFHICITLRRKEAYLLWERLKDMGEWRGKRKGERGSQKDIWLLLLQSLKLALCTRQLCEPVNPFFFTETNLSWNPLLYNQNRFENG